jgi:hypothetical protein
VSATVIPLGTSPLPALGPADMLRNIKEQVLAHAREGSRDCQAAVAGVGW